MTAKEIVVAYADALSKGDVRAAFSFFSAEVQWHQPGNNQFSGLKKGADEIGKMIGGMMEVSKGTFALKPNGNIMANGDLVAMPLRFSGAIDDRTMDMPGIDLFKVKEGKITEVWMFSDDQNAEDIFWGK